MASKGAVRFDREEQQLQDVVAALPSAGPAVLDLDKDLDALDMRAAGVDSRTSARPDSILTADGSSPD